MFTYYLKSYIYIYVLSKSKCNMYYVDRSIIINWMYTCCHWISIGQGQNIHDWGKKRFGFPILHHKLLPKLFELQRPNLVGTNLPLALLVPALLLNQKQAPLPSMVKDHCRLRMLLVRVYPRKVSIFSCLWLLAILRIVPIDCSISLHDLEITFLPPGQLQVSSFGPWQYQSPVQGIIGGWRIQNLCSYRCFWPFWEFRCARTTTESYYILPKNGTNSNHAESRWITLSFVWDMFSYAPITLNHAHSR